MTKLEEAELVIRKKDCHVYALPSAERKAIAEELDRLRGELAALKGEAEFTVYVTKLSNGTTANDAITRCLEGDHWIKIENADEGRGIYAVRLSARKVER